MSSYFSRLSVTTRRQTHEVDLAAIEEEINFSAARDEVMATVTLQHPIMFDQYNICAMVEEDTLNILKVSLLQVICQGLNLDIPNPPYFAVKLHTWSCLKKPPMIAVAKAKKLTTEEVTQASPVPLFYFHQSIGHFFKYILYK